MPTDTENVTPIGPRSSALARAACGHLLEFDPPASVGDVVFCRPCDDYRKITDADMDWLYTCVRCTQGRRLTRRFGADEHEARTAGQEHSQRYGHHVLLKHLGKVVGSFSPNM